MQERKVSLVPAPIEAAAAVFIGYFFWFLADGWKGAFIGLAAWAAVVVLTRLTAPLGTRQRTANLALWLGLAVGFVAAAPFIASGDFRTTQMATMGYLAIGVLSLNFLTGYTGQASIGHSAFMGVGAFTAAIMVQQWDAPMILAMGGGVLAAATLGFLVGLPALRLSGPYLAIATLGLAVIFAPFLKLNEIADYTGGRGGINLFSHTFSFPIDLGDWLNDSRWYYYLTVIFLGLGVLLLFNMLNSAVGRSFRAVRDNEIAAAATGVNVSSTKLTAFTISSAFAGFAGCLLFILSNRFISPESFSLFLGIEFLMAMSIGGVASIPGSLIGAFFLVYVYREGLETISTQTEGGSNTWLMLAGAALGGGLLFGSRWTAAMGRKYAPLIHQRYGQAIIALLKLALTVAIAAAFTWLVRLATEDLLDLVALRSAFAGVLLIIVILFLPYGMAGLIMMVQMLRWRDLLAILRHLVQPPAEPKPPTPPEPVPAPAAASD